MEVHHLDSKVLMSPSPSECQREFAGGEKISAEAANDGRRRGEGGRNHAIGCEKAVAWPAGDSFMATLPEASPTLPWKPPSKRERQPRHRAQTAATREDP